MMAVLAVVDRLSPWISGLDPLIYDDSFKLW
jgi:hypothetical protein